MQLIWHAEHFSSLAQDAINTLPLEGGAIVGTADVFVFTAFSGSSEKQSVTFSESTRVQVDTAVYHNQGYLVLCDGSLLVQFRVPQKCVRRLRCIVPCQGLPKSQVHGHCWSSGPIDGDCYVCTQGVSKTVHGADFCRVTPREKLNLSTRGYADDNGASPHGKSS